MEKHGQVDKWWYCVLSKNHPLRVIPLDYLEYFFSMWALATPAELESGLEQWKEKLQSGEADKIIAEFEEKRKQIGVTTTIVAYKI